MTEAIATEVPKPQQNGTPNAPYSVSRTAILNCPAIVRYSENVVAGHSGVDIDSQWL